MAQWTVGRSGFEWGEGWWFPSAAILLYATMTSLWTFRLRGWDFDFDGAASDVGREFARHVEAFLKLLVMLALIWQEWVLIRSVQGVHYPPLSHDIGVVTVCIIAIAMVYWLALRRFSRA